MILRVATALLVATLAVGCGSKSAKHVTHLDVHGLAFAAGYLDGASLTVYDAAGKKLDTPSVQTSNGTFVLKDVSLPTDFQVVTNGGTMKGQAFTGSLKLDVSGYERDQYLWINEATTLAANYRAAHPTHTVAEANTRVRNFLGLPQYLALGPGLVPKLPQFDHDRFATEALGSGGMDAFSAKLVRAMDAGPQRDPVRFPAAAAKNGEEDDIASLVLTAVAKGALSAGTGFAFGELMKQAGLTEDLGDQLNTLSATLQSFDTAMSNDLAKTEYTAVHSAFTTESALQIAMQRLAEMNTTSDATTKADDAHDVECYALAFALITKVPSNLANDPCGTFTVGGDYKTVLNVINGADSDVPLPEAWGDAYKANHSAHFYSSVDSDAATTEYAIWRNLVAAEAAVLAQGLGSDAANRTDQLPALVNTINAVTCDGGKTISCSGTTPSVTVGTLTQYEPPPVPDGAWIYIPDSTMWVLGTTSDGAAAASDTEGDFATFASDLNSSFENNPLASIDATTGADINVTLDGWAVPSKADVNALMGDHAGSTTPGQWLDGQTGQVAHSLLGNWDGNEIWTSDPGCVGISGGGFDADCKPSSKGFITFELDTALFTNEVTAKDEYALLVRTLGSDEVWTPKNW